MGKIKMLGICTSQRGKNSNSYFLLEKAFSSLIDESVEKKIIIASELKLFPCDHHYSVSAKMCVHPCLITQINPKDEMKIIYEEILKADIIIFSTPIYWGNHSQLMQLIVERLNSFENSNSAHKKVIIKNKIGGLMVLGHEDGYQHVVGGLMNFLTEMGLIFPPQAYAAWVGESDENTEKDRERLENDKLINEMFCDLVSNCVNFAKNFLFCPHCGKKFDYEHVSKKKNYIPEL